MKEILAFIYTYYAIYLYLIPVSIITCVFYIFSQYTKKYNIRTKAVYLLLIFLANVVISYIASEQSSEKLFENSNHSYFYGFLFNMFWALLIATFLMHMIWEGLKAFQIARTSGFIRDNKIGLAVFIILMLQLYTGLPWTMNGWSSCWYATDYFMGIGSRFLLDKF